MRLRQTQIPTSITVAPDTSKPPRLASGFTDEPFSLSFAARLLLTMHMRGVGEVNVANEACEVCVDPSFHSRIDLLLYREDGILGQAYVTMMNPSMALHDPVFDNIVYLIDGTDGFLRWMNTSLDGSGYSVIHPADILHLQNVVDAAPRALSRSTNFGRSKP